ncbi:ABC transporter permease subunit [Plantactinospora sp. B5E13]|uniref:ABC transporter permease subunit n=1 Tax=Plantactinospora sp. B5E13 TaxID=3153758 RepID=UPI00325E2E75
MNLVRAEFGRLAARRFVQLMVVLLVAAFTVTVLATLAGSRQPDAGEIQMAQQQADERRMEIGGLYDDCRQLEASGQSPADHYARDCEDLNPARIDASDHLPGVFVFDRQIRELAYFLIAFLCLFGFLVGASYIGADLTSGGMTNLLLWRPQRLLVLGTKLGTLLVGVLGLSLVSTVLYIASFRLVGEVRGMPGVADAQFWADLLLLLTRGLTLVLVASTLGFAIATLGRHTSAALGAAAAYGVVWEGGLRIVLEIVDAARPDVWMLSSYLGAWISGGLRFFANVDCFVTPERPVCDTSYTIGWPVGLAVLLGLVLVVVGAAFATFRRRDLA